MKKLILLALFLFSIPGAAWSQSEDLIRATSQSAFLGMIEAVRTGINMYRANDIVEKGPPGNYPTVLDKQPDGPCTACFVDVLLDGGLNSTDWQKKGLHYFYTKGGFQGEAVYDPKTGEVKTKPE